MTAATAPLMAPASRAESAEVALRILARVRLRWAERATSKPWTLQASRRIDRALIACEEFGVRS